ncbi:pseudouridylate synthase 1 homolog [Lutzomyia longipalpis]|uniref:pseudouridylate synthase 1 homolog n=1 Tax=Lutzomyia longipalpis TaxID=7200 RepID=UPI0024839A11|nr:pseudouridylate synthase 1 homolog [Lutzomyia longipalpis]
MLKFFYQSNRIVCRSTGRLFSSFTGIMSEAIDVKKAEIALEKQRKKEYKSRYDGSKKRCNWVTTPPSGTTEEGPEGKKACLEPFVRIKRKKSVVLLGYAGKDYYGMQRNPDVKTVEQELLSAMLKHKWITEEAYNMPQSIAFQRAARTDKGVSAVRQCVSLKLPLELDVPALNTDLPKEIRVFAVRTVTQGFNSKNDCMARTYTYTLPTIALDKDAWKDTAVDTVMEGYRIPREIIEKFGDVLKKYEGTKNYHNFTIKKEHLDPSAKRYITSFTTGEPFVVKDVEFMVLKVTGQSFMMHQIRKMVGLALSIIRGHENIDMLDKAFTAERIYIPRAPGLGLVLDRLHYDRYNRRYGNDGIHCPLTWEEFEEEIQQFVREQIYPIITETEITDKPFLNWLEMKLSNHNYAGRSMDDQENSEDEDEWQDEGKATKKVTQDVDLPENIVNEEPMKSVS